MVFMAATAGVMPADGATRGRKPKPSYSEERNTKTATVTQTPTPTPKPAPIATPMPMLATAAPTPAPSTTPTNTLNGKAATPQREIFVPWLRFFPLTVIVPDTGLTRVNIRVFVCFLQALAECSYGLVLINAQMSGFGDEAEILCSTRALPVLTQLRHGRLTTFAAQKHCSSSDKA